jgi:hypothetical protein
MITNTLFRKYQQVLNKKRMDVGGTFSANTNQTGIGAASAISGDVPYAMIGNTAAGLLDDVSVKNAYGYNAHSGDTIGGDALKGAGYGAAVGSVIPGVGTLLGAGIGATIGAGYGIIDAKNIKAKSNNAENNQMLQQRLQSKAMSNAVEDPGTRLGYEGASYFADGGYLKNGGGIHIKPSHKGMFTRYKERTGKTTAEALHSKDKHVRQMANFARNASHWHHKANGGAIAGEAPGGEGAFGSYLPLASLKSEDGSNPNLERNPLSEMMMQNGDAKMLSSNNTVIQGPSHADGGVDIPELGTQVEGGETTKDNFVYSKQLGFARLHLPIARAIGKIEKKPQTPDRVNALKRLRGREDELANQQETLKAKMGIQ